MPSTSEVIKELGISRTMLYYYSILSKIVPKKEILNGRARNIYSPDQVEILRKNFKDRKDAR